MSRPSTLRTACHVGLLASTLWASFGASANPRELPPPLACPQCGDWQINDAQPSGATGERIAIHPETMDFPGCGRFRVEAAKQSVSTDTDRHRTYHTTLSLMPIQPESLCAVPDGALVRMEIETRVGYQKDGGMASFSVYKPGEAKPVVTAEAWNFERDNPCDSGSGRGSAACMQIANARTYKLLASEVYDAHAGLNPRLSSDLARQFNVASFAAATLRFCLDREAGNGGGSWPYVWGLSCQSERLQSKLVELRAWRLCVQKPGRQCQVPTNRFDHSKAAQ